MENIDRWCDPDSGHPYGVPRVPEVNGVLAAGSRAIRACVAGASDAWATRELRAGGCGKAVGGPMWDERDLLPLLTVIKGSSRGASFRLSRGVRVIGREPGVDVPLDDVKVSRRHATVTVAEDGVMLADAGSTNGTWLNGERLVGPRPLCDGDRVRFGHVEMRFFDPATAATVPVAGRYAPVLALAANTAIGATPPGPVRLAAAGTTAVTTVATTAPLAVASSAANRMLWAMAGLLAVAGLALAYLVLG